MAPYVCNWGIIGCGGISGTFARDIALKRDVTDVAHAVVAVASRSKSRAEAFIQENLPRGASAQQMGLAGPARAYGSYGELFADDDVKIVYIGTLHETHYDDVKAALEAGKSVLVEKPAVLNAAEWADLCRIAKSKQLFLMEALWTRLQPAVLKLHEVIHVDKAIGDVRFVNTNFNVQNYNDIPDTHRLLGLAHAGGPLLDVGAYCMIPARVALQDTPGLVGGPQVSTQMTLARTGVDLATTLILHYPQLSEARAICSMNFNARAPRDYWGTISGTRGEILIGAPPGHRLTTFTIRRMTDDGGWEEDEVVDIDVPGMGLHLEADAAARDLRDGRLENERVPHSETQRTFEIFDQARREGGYVLPEGMERVGRVGV